MNTLSSLFRYFSPSSSQVPRQSSFTVMGVFFLGFFTRLYACIYTSIINPDGTLYIHQARAIYYGVWDQLTTCSLRYVSAYPPLIAAAYPLFHDWINAARFVSLFFSTMSIVPAYLLFKRFFPFHVSISGTLIFALTPTFIAGTADVIKEPFAWFFALLGLFLFVLNLDTKRKIHAVLSAISYLIAAWARPEVFLFFCVSGLYLFFVKRGKKAWWLFCYFSPLVAIILACAIGAKLLGISFSDLYRVQQMLSKASEPFDTYRSLETTLQSLIRQTQIGYLRLFLEQARHLIWAVALATVVSYIVEAFFYPFFLFFLIGLKGLGARLRNDKRALYLALLTFSSVVLLYLNMLQSWFGTARFMYLVILPALVFVAAGLEKTIGFLTDRFKLRPAIAVSMVFCFILFFGLPNDLKPRETDKLVFTEMGEFIAKRENSSKPVRIAGLYTTRLRLVSFYANLDYPGAPCPISDALRTKGGHVLIPDLKKEGVRYLLWEEKAWSNQEPRSIDSPFEQQFREVGVWRHRDTGRIVLYEIK
jgi:hypothetical protein